MHFRSQKVLVFFVLMFLWQGKNATENVLNVFTNKYTCMVTWMLYYPGRMLNYVRFYLLGEANELPQWTWSVFVGWVVRTRLSTTVHYLCRVTLAIFASISNWLIFGTTADSICSVSFPKRKYTKPWWSQRARGAFAWCLHSSWQLDWRHKNSQNCTWS